MAEKPLKALIIGCCTRNFNQDILGNPRITFWHSTDKASRNKESIPADVTHVIMVFKFTGTSWISKVRGMMPKDVKFRTDLPVGQIKGYLKTEGFFNPPPPIVTVKFSSQPGLPLPPSVRAILAKPAPVLPPKPVIPPPAPIVKAVPPVVQNVDPPVKAVRRSSVVAAATVTGVSPVTESKPEMPITPPVPQRKLRSVSVPKVRTVGDMFDSMNKPSDPIPPKNPKANLEPKDDSEQDSMVDLEQDNISNPTVASPPVVAPPVKLEVPVVKAAPVPVPPPPAPPAVVVAPVAKVEPLPVVKVEPAPPVVPVTAVAADKTMTDSAELITMALQEMLTLNARLRATLATQEVELAELRPMGERYREMAKISDDLRKENNRLWQENNSLHAQRKAAG